MIRIVRLSFKEEYIQDFERLFEERKQQIRAIDGCTQLALWADKQDAGVFYTYSIWQHADHLEAYRVSTLFQETWGQVKQWFKEKPLAFSADQLLEL